MIYSICVILDVILAGKQKKATKKQEVKKSKQPSPKKGAGESTLQNAAASSQAAPAVKPKRYSSQRQRQTQPMPLPVHQSMMPQMGEMYPGQAYYEQLGELASVDSNF